MYCHRPCILILIVGNCLLLPPAIGATVDESLSSAEARALFSPRIEYNNEWRPVGHSDPLKNDPTFDYSPPVLDRVRYWSEPSTPSVSPSNGVNEKKEILLLGVPSKHMLYTHPNQVAQTEPKTSNRRMFYAPQPSRMLTPPPMPHMMQMGFQSDYTPHYWHPEDTNGAESASHVTILKPKASPNPYLATSPSVYKDVRQTIYNFAANVNALEGADQKRPWLQNLLQKEFSYYTPTVMPTTSQVEMSYSPAMFESHSTSTIDVPQTQYHVNRIESTTFTPATTIAPIALTTDELFAHYKQPAEPMRGPMYLIIQGHSKVKTYGGEQLINQTLNHSPKMVPIPTERNPVISHVVSKDARGHVMQVEHLHKMPTQTNATAVDSLLSLLDSSLMGFLTGDNKIKSTTGKKATAKPNEAKHTKHNVTKKASTIRVTTISTTPVPVVGNSTNPSTIASVRDIS